MGRCSFPSYLLIPHNHHPGVSGIDRGCAPPPQFDLAFQTPRLESYKYDKTRFSYCSAFSPRFGQSLDGSVIQLVSLLDFFENVDTADLRIEQVSLGVTPGATRQFE